MAEEKLLTVRDVSSTLGISEREVLDLADSGMIPAYKVGGVYLRFKREQVDDFRKRFTPPVHKAKTSRRYLFKDNFSDFFYFNDFYILAGLVILLILVIIFRG